ncbi:hypothetical protein BDR04DRAFT_1094709 [Suillus decipiens]|nr:hypothetical protein BDR04DRAFT_1094709 [Suillus decipiens]
MYVQTLSSRIRWATTPRCCIVFLVLLTGHEYLNEAIEIINICGLNSKYHGNQYYVDVDDVTVFFRRSTVYIRR